MGVNGLFGFLRNARLIQRIPIQTLRGQRVAVDTPAIMYQASLNARGVVEKKALESLYLDQDVKEIISNTNHLFYFLESWIQLSKDFSQNELSPCFVFDGKIDDDKQQILEARRTTKAKVKEKLGETLPKYEKKKEALKKNKTDIEQKEQIVKEKIKEVIETDEKIEVLVKLEEEENKLEEMLDLIQLQKEVDEEIVEEVVTKLKEEYEMKEGEIFDESDPSSLNASVIKEKIKAKKEKRLQAKANLSKEKKMKKEQTQKLADELKQKEIQQKKDEKKIKQDTADIMSMLNRSFTLKSVHYDIVRSFVRFLGLPHLQLPGDAEFACSALARQGLVDFVLCNDSDALACGSPSLISYNGFTHKSWSFTRTELIQLEKIHQWFGYSDHEKFVQFCLLSGTDYLPGIKLGPQAAHDLMKKYPDFYSIPQIQSLGIEEVKNASKKFLVYPHEHLVKTTTSQKDIEAFMKSLKKKKLFSPAELDKLYLELKDFELPSF